MPLPRVCAAWGADALSDLRHTFPLRWRNGYPGYGLFLTAFHGRALPLSRVGGRCWYGNRANAAPLGLALDRLGVAVDLSVCARAAGLLPTTFRLANSNTANVDCPSMGATIMSEFPAAFRPIKLKTTPHGVSPPFPSRICSIGDAMKFVESHVASDPAKRAKLHWTLAISTLLDVAANRSDRYAHVRNAMHHALAIEGWAAD